jgi:hypothetical protein
VDPASATEPLPDDPCHLCGSLLGVRDPSGWSCAICGWRVGDVPDGDLAPPRIDIVYYLRLDERLKIGTTANPRQRFAALGHDEVVAFERGDRALEQRRHREFAEWRLGSSEWFAFSEPLRAHVAVLGAGVLDPWSLWARWVSEAIRRG